MQRQNKRGYQLVTEGAAAVCAMKTDSPISDLLLSVHLNGCRQHSDIPPTPQPSTTARQGMRV